MDGILFYVDGIPYRCLDCHSNVKPNAHLTERCLILVIMIAIFRLHITGGRPNSATMAHGSTTTTITMKYMKHRPCSSTTTNPRYAGQKRAPRRWQQQHIDHENKPRL